MDTTPTKRIRNEKKTPSAPPRKKKAKEFSPITRQCEFCPKNGCKVIHDLVTSTITRDVVVTYGTRWVLNSLAYEPYYLKFQLETAIPFVFCKPCYFGFLEKKTPATLSEADHTMLLSHSDDKERFVMNTIFMINLGTVFLHKPKTYVDCMIEFGNSTKEFVRTPPLKKRRLVK